MKKTNELLGEIETMVDRRGGYGFNRHSFRAFKQKVMDMFEEEMPPPPPPPKKPKPLPVKKKSNDINIGQAQSAVKKAVKKVTRKSK